MPPTPPPLHPRALDRARGCLLGLAVGEALGRPLEALSAEQVRAALAAGPRLASDAGDQAAMAAIVAESLLEHGRLDLRDLSRRLVAWTRGGARDVGRVAARALYLQSQGQPWADAARAAWEEAHPRGATAEALARRGAEPADRPPLAGRRPGPARRHPRPHRRAPRLPRPGGSAHPGREPA